MASMQFCPEELFDAFPEPALIFRDGQAHYFNPAAARIFPLLKLDASLPEELSALLDEAEGSTVLLTRIAGIGWRVSIQATSAGLLAIFRAAEDENTPLRTDRLSLQLRQQTAGLAAALQRLFPGQALTAEKYEQYLSTANQGLYRLMRLADHLDFLERDRVMGFAPAPMDLAGLCREVAESMEDLCRGSGYHFSYESDLISLITEGDDIYLRRMLLALLSNAMKAAGKGGKFGMRFLRRGKRAIITVWDNGPGLETGNMSFLFGGEAAKLPSLDAGDGLGLGLAAVQRAASLHGGTIMLESRVDDGLRAVVSLPLRTPETGMTLRTPKTAYSSEHFSDLLVEFSDILPSKVYSPEETE